MSINFHKVSKWYHMLIGNSSYHVNQGVGRIYSKSELLGYYNDLTEKVTRFGYPDDQIPSTVVDTGETIYFSIAIFQYGLASYDLFLLSEKKDVSMLDKAIACANWAIDNQREDGSWITFAFENPEYPYSAMAQGEAISLLLRVFQETKEDKYLIASRKAKCFMLSPFEKGGPTKYEGEDIYLYECPRDPLILNGWIFSLWGLLDYCIIVDDSHTKELFKKSLDTLEKRLPDFNLSYWSRYDDGKRISSPFYHRLHIAQLNVMYDLTGKSVFKEYADLWQSYLNNWLYRMIAFVIKAWQKVFE